MIRPPRPAILTPSVRDLAERGVQRPSTVERIIWVNQLGSTGPSSHRATPYSIDGDPITIGLGGLPTPTSRSRLRHAADGIDIPAWADARATAEDLAVAWTSGYVGAGRANIAYWSLTSTETSTGTECPGLAAATLHGRVAGLRDYQTGHDLVVGCPPTRNAPRMEERPGRTIVLAVGESDPWGEDTVPLRSGDGALLGCGVYGNGAWISTWQRPERACRPLTRQGLLLSLARSGRAWLADHTIGISMMDDVADRWLIRRGIKPPRHTDTITSRIRGTR